MREPTSQDVSKQIVSQKVAEARRPGKKVEDGLDEDEEVDAIITRIYWGLRWIT